MRLLCQLVSKEDGFRSEPFTCTRADLRTVVEGFGEVADQSYLLILAEVDSSDQDGMNIRISQCPLVVVSELADFLKEPSNV